MTGTIYDGVVLAAGKNTRLKGVVPSYYKPLMVINGKPLIVTIVRNALFFCKHVVVVVSPQNAQAISEVLDDNSLFACELGKGPRVTLVVQPKALGPGDGLRHGMQACRSKRILLLLGDNIIPAADFQRIVKEDYTNVMADEKNTGIVTVSTTIINNYEDSQRFTRIVPNLMKHKQLTFIEGIPGTMNLQNEYLCWIGPMIFDRAEAEFEFTRAFHEIKGELKVSGPISNLKNLSITCVPGSSVDVGTSDALLEHTGEQVG